MTEDKEENNYIHRTFAMNDEICVATHKILLVGGTGVGKTCILKRFVDGEFPTTSKATLGKYIEAILFWQLSKTYIEPWR